MANSKIALGLGVAALGGGLLWALSGKSETKTNGNGVIPIEDLPESAYAPAEYYPDIPDEDLLFYYEDMLVNASDYNFQAALDMINTLAYRGFEEQAQTLANAYGVQL